MLLYLRSKKAHLKYLEKWLLDEKGSIFWANLMNEVHQNQQNHAFIISEFHFTS